MRISKTTIRSANSSDAGSQSDGFEKDPPGRDIGCAGGQAEEERQHQQHGERGNRRTGERGTVAVAAPPF
jgi:hypothetical protein